MFCQNCGKERVAGEGFCTECGHRFDGMVGVGENAPAVPEKRNETIAILASFAALIGFFLPCFEVDYYFGQKSFSFIGFLGEGMELGDIRVIPIVLIVSLPLVFAFIAFIYSFKAGRVGVIFSVLSAIVVAIWILIGIESIREYMEIVDLFTNAKIGWYLYVIGTLVHIIMKKR